MGIQLFGLLDAEHFLEIGKEAVFSRSTAQRGALSERLAASP